MSGHDGACVCAECETTRLFRYGAAPADVTAALCAAYEAGARAAQDAGRSELARAEKAEAEVVRMRAVIMRAAPLAWVHEADADGARAWEIGALAEAGDE